MKTLKAGLRNRQTTIVGLALAALLVIQQKMAGGIALDDPQLWIAILVAVLGFLVRDADKSSERSGLR